MWPANKSQEFIIVMCIVTPHNEALQTVDLVWFLPVPVHISFCQIVSISATETEGHFWLSAKLKSHSLINGMVAVRVNGDGAGGVQPPLLLRKSLLCLFLWTCLTFFWQIIRGLLKYWPKTCTQKEVRNSVLHLTVVMKSLFVLSIHPKFHPRGHGGQIEPITAVIGRRQVDTLNLWPVLHRSTDRDNQPFTPQHVFKYDPLHLH